MADFSFLEISWKCHPAVVSRFEKSLKFVGENFLPQVCRETTRKDALDLLVGNGEGLVGDGVVLATVIMKWFSLKMSVQ